MECCGGVSCDNGLEEALLDWALASASGPPCLFQAISQTSADMISDGGIQS